MLFTDQHSFVLFDFNTKTTYNDWYLKTAKAQGLTAERKN